MKRLAAFVLTAMIGAAPAFASADDEEARIERARDALKRRLEEARSEGAIHIRGSQQEAPDSSNAMQPAAADPPAIAYDRTDCLTIEDLSEISESLGADPLASIEALRTSLLEEAPGARGKIELQLAQAYLAIGFTEEAIAIAGARHGPEAAGVYSLGRLAEGDFNRAREVAAPFADCGAIYALAINGASMADSTEAAAAAAGTVKELPVGLRAPIAEALAVELIDRNPTLAAEFDAIGRAEPVVLATPERRFLDAVADKADPASREAALAQLASTPSPVRGRAIKELAETIEHSAPEDKAAFDDNLAEAARSAEGTERVSLNEMLGKRLVGEGDFQRGLKALGAALSSPAPARNKSDALLQGAVAAGLNSKDPHKRLSALAAVADDEAIAQSALTPSQAQDVAGDLALLGAARAVERIAASTRINEREADFALARAHLRGGRMEAAFAIASRRANDPQFASILAISGAEIDAKPLINEAIVDAAPALLAKSLWRAGELAALSSLAGRKSDDPEVATRIAFAALSLGKAPPPRTLERSADSEGLRLMARPAPDLATSVFGDLRDFSESVESEIDWLKKRYLP